MRYLYISFCIVSAIAGICSALPLHQQATNRNVFIIGTLAFLSFGAIIIGCVCCRRRKKGFEEFTNDSGTQESNKNEYPIFRALSPESQRNDHVENINNNQELNNSNENLIIEDTDNNNGPISPTDLENIENNNAVDYIHNQNEIDVVIDPSLPVCSRNCNLNAENIEADSVQIHIDDANEISNGTINSVLIVGSENQYEENKLPASNDDCNTTITDVIQDVAITSTTNSFHNDVTNDTIKESGVEEIVVTNNIKLLENTIVPENCNINTHVPISYEEAKIISKEINDNDKSIDINFCNGSTTAIAIEGQIMVKDKCVSLEMSPERDEIAFLQCDTSDKTNEVSSVEEALRALDIAIGNEESGNDYDDEYDSSSLPEENFSTDSNDFQNVLRDLLINNGVNDAVLPNLVEIHLSQKDYQSKVDNIRCQAIEFVDEILNESRLIAAEERDKNKINNIGQNTICFAKDNTFDVSNFKPNETEVLQKTASEYPKTDFTQHQDEKIIQRGGSFEDFFDNDLMDKSSTPCVQNKYAISTKTSIAKKGIIFADQKSPINETNENFNYSTDGSPLMDGKNDATFDAVISTCQQQNVNETFDLNNKTYDTNDLRKNDFTYPGDPCTSRQALERDQGLIIKCQRYEITSDDLNTITPVNTPIELNYNQETWNKMTNKDDDGKNGWFLHPQMYCDENVNETVDISNDDCEENLELTFEALRKQLAEVLPQPQGMAGPPEFSDDEEEPNSNRTFDEYRSPLDGLFGLLEIDNNSPQKEVQNEMFINYKRSLSPIMEESEEETCRTFAVNETKCLDNSTSTGCIEAIMGVTKTLMASNDTLFNFDDTLGDKEDVFSPRLASRNNSEATTPVKSGKTASSNTSQATTITTSSDTEKADVHQQVEKLNIDDVVKKVPPKTIEFAIDVCFGENDLCSPDQQKTFSEGTTSSTTDRLSSDLSPTLDNEATFTTNTNDDKTCVTVIIKDDERISEISEPEWESNASYNIVVSTPCDDTNSLADVPSLDFNVNNFETDEPALFENTHFDEDVTEKSNDKDSGQDDSGHSTQASTDGKSNTSHNISAPETDSNEEINFNNHDRTTPCSLSTTKDNCEKFITSEVKFSSSSHNAETHNKSNKAKSELKGNFIDNIKSNDRNCNDTADDAIADNLKENADPNVHHHQNHLTNGIVPLLMLSSSSSLSTIPSSNDEKFSTYQKVQINSQDAVIIDKSKTNVSADLIENEETSNISDKFAF